MKNKILLFIAINLLPFMGKAQEVTTPQMSDAFRSEGKIYVVIAVISIIFICIISYLVFIDAKLRKLENKNKN